MLFFLILNNKIVIQRFRPQATPSPLSASLKRSVWGSSALISKRPRAVVTRTSHFLGFHFRYCKRRVLDTAQEQKEGSSCMGEKKWLTVDE